MTGIKADWRLSELQDGDDPFDTVILSSGLRVDLGGSVEEIHQGLRESLGMEAALFDKGVTCELKDGGQDCLTCQSFTARPEDERSPLCLLGRDQRTMENETVARAAPLKELVGKVAEWSEIGHLSDEYAELLTFAGL